VAAILAATAAAAAGNGVVTPLAWCGAPAAGCLVGVAPAAAAAVVVERLRATGLAVADVAADETLRGVLGPGGGGFPPAPAGAAVSAAAAAAAEPYLRTTKRNLKR